MGTRRLLVGGVGLALAMLPLTGTAFARSAPKASSAVSPQYRSCSPGWQFAVSSQLENHAFTGLEKGTLIINPYNPQGGNAPVTLTSTLSYNVSRSASTSTSLGGGWGPINASIGYNVDVSQSFAVSQSVTITIDPGYEGYQYYGVAQSEWYGNYYYLQSDCTYTSNYIHVYSPLQKAIEKVSYRIP